MPITFPTVTMADITSVSEAGSILATDSWNPLNTFKKKAAARTLGRKGAAKKNARTAKARAGKASASRKAGGMKRTTRKTTRKSR